MADKCANVKPNILVVLSFYKGVFLLVLRDVECVSYGRESADNGTSMKPHKPITFI